jgi:ABC-type transport system involved in multi-copper enzyme maturation permease subunit
MMNLWKSELYRLTKSKGFYLFWGLSVFVFMTTVLYHNSGGISMGAPLDFNETIKLDIRQAAMNTTYYFFLIFPVFSIISGEFSEHTIKNTVSSAVSKSKYFVSKFLFTLIYSLSAFTVVNYLFYFINRLINGSKYSSSFTAFSRAILGQLPLFAAVISLFIFLAFLLKKGAAFNSVVIITPLAYSSIAMILYEIESTRKLAEKMLTYELSMMIRDLTIGCSDSYRMKCYVIFAAIVVLSFVFGSMIWKKRELD